MIKPQYPPLAHQKEGIEFIMNGTPVKGLGGLKWGTGVGKTYGTLHFFERVRQHIPKIRLLIVCTVSLLEKAWGDDIKKFTNYKYFNLHKNGPKIKMFHLKDTDIFLINYESILSDKYRKAIEDLIKFTGDDWICVLDESSKIKNFKAQTTKHLLKMRDLFRFRMVMSGTMAPNSEMEYWAQLTFVNPGIFGDSFYAFRNRFFHLQNRYTGHAIPNGARMPRAAMQELFKKCDYVLTEAKRAELLSVVKCWVHVAEKKKCTDLPPTVDEVRGIQMQPVQLAAYKKMERDLILEFKGVSVTAPVALTKVMKLRQITSGFVYDEMQNGHPVCEGLPPKLQELLNIIEENPGQPIIIWIQFHWETLRICHELHKLYGPEQVVTISSKDKDRDGSIDAFQKGRARFLVAHPKSGAHGLTFINCSLQVFYTLDYSYENYEQCRGRTDRYGQTESTTYIHLIAENTIDEEILETVRGKSDAQEIAQKYLRKIETF